MDALVGLFGGHPVPLEYSGVDCTNNCQYCFAKGYSCQESDYTKFQNLIRNLDKRENLAVELFRAGQPVLLSNRSDPFCEAKANVLDHSVITVFVQKVSGRVILMKPLHDQHCRRKNLVRNDSASRDRRVHGACEIDYWIRGEENLTECAPQSPCCPKCPQWTCLGGCHE